jgi:glycosyltransferase involved in cell wall biosynthesis
MSEKERRTRGRLQARSKRRGFLGRFSRRLKEENLPEPEEINLEPIVKDVDAAIASRRRRLNVKMASALKEFREVRAPSCSHCNTPARSSPGRMARDDSLSVRLSLLTSPRLFTLCSQEVLDETQTFVESSKKRQERLAARQGDIKNSLSALREDLLAEVTAQVEDGLLGVKRGGKTLEKALRQIRQTWEDEVNDLVNEAKADVDVAVADIEQTIDKRREEWSQSIVTFDDLWEVQGKRPRFNVTSGSGNGVGKVLSRTEIQARVKAVQDSIALISNEVESDLKLFKQRWEVTTGKLEGLPTNFSKGKVKSLADMRMYVADTVFAGDVPALLSERGTAYQNVTRDLLSKVARESTTTTRPGFVTPPSSGLRDDADPLGIRQETTNVEASDPVLRPTAASNLRLPGRQIAIVTTASLPWMTGTSINPLLRAAYLSKSGYDITLVLPWISPEQQAELFPKGPDGPLTFERPALQDQYIRWWLENRGNVEAPDLRIRWYPALWSPYLGSIIQDIDDITTIVPQSERDVVILEEPEHLNWYHHGRRWTDMYQHVVGIAHTNYLQYSRQNTKGIVKSGVLKEGFTRIINDLVCAGHTDLVVKLSATLPDVPARNLVCNVHGVRAEFLAIGAAVDTRDSGAYFLGKAMYTKGYRELIDALSLHKGSPLPPIDTYGSGEEYDDIVAEIDASGLPITPHAGIDHAHPTMHGYRVFVNPSTSDVLCTATAEALAMGKKVVIPDHPSNQFFKQFSNTLMYTDPADLVPLLEKALASEPEKM